MANPNRTIIIPKDTLNSDEVNVVVIPPSLQNSTLPLIVTAKGNKLTARSLPIWGDELDPFNGPAELDETETYEDMEYPPDYVSTTICASPREDAPQILHMSSRTMTVSSEGPPESFEFDLDAPEGVDQNVLRVVLEQSAGRPRRRGNQPSPVQDMGQSEFSPPFNSTFAPSYNSTFAGSMSGCSMGQSAPSHSRSRRGRSRQQEGCGPC